MLCLNVPGKMRMMKKPSRLMQDGSRSRVKEAIVSLSEDLINFS